MQLEQGSSKGLNAKLVRGSSKMQKVEPGIENFSQDGA